MNPEKKPGKIDKTEKRRGNSGERIFRIGNLSGLIFRGFSNKHEPKIERKLRKNPVRKFSNPENSSTIEKLKKCRYQISLLIFSAFLIFGAILELFAFAVCALLVRPFNTEKMTNKCHFDLDNKVANKITSFSEYFPGTFHLLYTRIQCKRWNVDNKIQVFSQWMEITSIQNACHD